MLKSLSLNNFKKLEALKVEFSPRLTLISGKNYQGKSTLLHGILYALGGARLVPGGYAIIRNKQTGKKEKVQLAFNINNADYVVERSGNNASLHKNGKLEATGTSSVNSEISKIIGMPLKLFTATHYSAQGEAKMLVEMGAPALNRLLEDACEVDLIDRVLDRLKTRHTRFEAQLEIIPDVVIKDLEDKVSCSLEATTALNDQFEKAKVLAISEDTGLSETEHILREVMKNNNIIVEEGSQRAVAKEKLVAAVLSVESISEEQAALPTCSPVHELCAEVAALESTSSKLKDAKTLAELHSANRNKKGKELITEKESLAVLETRLSAIPERVDTANMIEERDKVKEALAVARRQVGDTTTLLEGGVCPTCNRAHEGFNESETESILALAKDEEANLSLQKDKLDRDIDAQTELNTSCTAVHSLVKIATDNAARIESELNDIEDTSFSEANESELIELGKKLAHAKEEHAEAIRIEAKETLLMEQKLAANTALETCKTNLEALPEPEGEVEKIAPYEAAVDAAKVAYNAAEKESNRLESVFLAETTIWKAATTELAKAKESAVQRKDLEKSMITGTNLTKFLRENRSKFMDNLWASITGMASNMLTTCTDGAMSSVTRGTGGEFMYTENGQEMPIAAASGAQKALIGSSLKQGIRAAMPAGIPVYLADEITSEMDAEHAFAISSQLAASGEQVIAVSHREQDGFAADCQVVL